jgi:hypothetical protein
MNLAQIAVHLAVPLPSILILEDDPIYLDSFYSTLEEMVASSGSFIFPLYGLGTFSPEIRWLHDEIELHQVEDFFASAALRECEHLVFSIEVPYEEEEDAELLLPGIVMKRISDFLIMVNLCHPGLIELKTSELVHNGILQEHTSLPKMDGISIQSALVYSGKMNWPHLRTLKLIDAWNWHLQRKTYLEMEGFENDPTSRAINAFSRLFESPTMDIAMHLVWAMVGIEALYVRGKDSVMQQVRDKVPSVLGEHEMFKKGFKKMYEFRSRFIHGDLDIPGLYHLGDAGAEIEKYHTDQERTVSFAVAILTASLQEIITGNWKMPEST